MNYYFTCSFDEENWTDEEREKKNLKNPSMFKKWEHLEIEDQRNL